MRGRMLCYKPQELTENDVMIVESLTRRRFIVGAGGLIGAGALSGCGASGRAGTPVATPPMSRRFTHVLGETDVPIHPQRIIALHNEAVANTMLQLGVVPLASVNGPDFVTIGEVTFPPSVVSVGDYSAPNIEQIAALKPDLIISSANVHDEIYPKLSAIAPTVSVFDIGATDALATPRVVADLINKSDVLAAQIAAYDTRVQRVRSQLAPLLDTLEVSVFGVYGDSIITTRHPGWTSVKALKDLGVTWSKGAITHSNEESFASLSYEEVPALDADVIFLVQPEAKDVEAVRATGILDLTFAGKAGQIFVVDDGPWYRGGIAGLNLVLNDIETYLVKRTVDTSGDFRSS